MKHVTTLCGQSGDLFTVTAEGSSVYHCGSTLKQYGYFMYHVF